MPDLSKLPIPVDELELDEDPPDDLEVEDDDFLDHPNFFYGEEMILDEEEETLFPLFPNGREQGASEEEIEEWKALFEGDASLRSLAPLSAAATLRAAAPRTAGRYNGNGRDLGIADRLRAYGLKVVEVAGWQTRGAATFHPRGSVDHHTAAGKHGNAPSLNICTHGRSDLPGPLCHVLIARDNTCYVIASGRANHAGSGSWKGVTGNSNMYGVERENTGVGSEPWREDQRVTAAKVHAALLDWRRDANMVCQHKEWTSRKIDVWDQSGPDMRSRVHNVWTGAKIDPEDKEEDEMRVELAWFKDEKGGGPHCYAITGNMCSWLPTHEVIALHRFLGVPWSGGTEAKSILDHEWWQGKAMLNGPLQNVHSGGLNNTNQNKLNELVRGMRSTLESDQAISSAIQQLSQALAGIDSIPAQVGDVHVESVDAEVIANAVVEALISKLVST